MAEKKNSRYLSGKEVRAIAKENRKVMTALEKRKHRRAHESEFTTTMKDPDNILEIEDLHTYFFTDQGVVKAVNGVSFEVPRNATVGVVGESGCGKSVTSMSIMQLLQGPQGQIYSGDIRFASLDYKRDARGNPIPTGEQDSAGSPVYEMEDKVYNIANMPIHEFYRIRGRQIAMIFQEPMTSLNPVFTIGDQLDEVTFIHVPGATKTLAWSRSMKMLNLVGIAAPERVYEAYPHELSGGMRQRVMIAMALACNPRLIIADEPTTALDVTIQAQILDLLRDLKTKMNGSILLITHDLGIIAEMADYVVVMYAGRVIERGTVEEIFHNPLHPYTVGLQKSKPTLELDSDADSLFNIPGNVPNPVNMPNHCYFKERCSKCTAACSGDYPCMRQVSPTHYVACHLYGEEGKTHECDTAKSPLLQVRDLRKCFPLKKSLMGKVQQELVAVDDVSFDLYPGETLGIVGESGCGKTTMGRTILKLHQPSGGQILYDGKDITDYSPSQMRSLRTEMQIIFQDPYSSLPPRSTVGDILSEPVKVHKIVPPSEVRNYVIKLMEQCGLRDYYYERYPHEFSGGQRQRICIARALAVNPKLVVCDEPVSALDVSIQAQIINLLKQLQRERNLTYLFISHDLSVVKFISDKIGVMYLGSMVEFGSKKDIFSNPLHPYTKALFSAIPSPDPDKKMNRIVLKGDIPSPANPPSGCRFHTRCRHATQMCSMNAPMYREYEPGHFVACDFVQS